MFFVFWLNFQKHHTHRNSIQPTQKTFHVNFNSSLRFSVSLSVRLYVSLSLYVYLTVLSFCTYIWLFSLSVRLSVRYAHFFISLFLTLILSCLRLHLFVTFCHFFIFLGFVFHSFVMFLKVQFRFLVRVWKKNRVNPLKIKFINIALKFSSVKCYLKICQSRAGDFGRMNEIEKSRRTSFSTKKCWTSFSTKNMIVWLVSNGNELERKNNVIVRNINLA